MNDKWLRFTLAVTVPITFTLVLLGATIRNSPLNEAIAGGLIAVLGAIVALFAVDRKGGPKE
ncbi:MAG: hypothetical protein EBU42_08090 [Synechococcus sp.]|nr:hypothetical protein [Synechococcus sp.]